MADYPYTTVPGKLKPFLEKIRTVGVPNKVDLNWLKIIGFKSSNDRSLIYIIKYIGFIDQSGKPTSTWTSFRGANYKFVLGDAIRSGYSELYKIYPNAHIQSTSELTHVFSTSSSAGAQAIAKTVATFKTLTQEAEFAEDITKNKKETRPEHTNMEQGHAGESMPLNASTARSPEIHIDIQIHISPESNADQIDAIFKSMSKHLYREVKR